MNERDSMRNLFLKTDYQLGDTTFTTKAISDTFVVLQHGDTESVMSRDEFEAAAVLPMRFVNPVVRGSFHLNGVMMPSGFLAGPGSTAHGTWWIDLNKVPREYFNLGDA